MFVIGRGRRPLLLLAYWMTVVMIGAAGTAIGDYLAGRHMFGLALSTAITAIVFIVLLLV